MEDPLDNLENMANAAGETPLADANENEQAQAIDNDIVSETEPEPEPVPVVRKSAMDIALLNKTESEQIHILQAAVARGLDKDDPVIDIYNAASSAARSANSVASAAIEVIDTVNAIPKIVQDAAFAGGNDVAGVIHQTFDIEFDDFKKKLSAGIRVGAGKSIGVINKSAEDAATKISESVNTLHKAISEIDSEMDKEIIARRDSVISNWVQSGSDELNKRINEAVKKERSISLGFLTFTMSAVFIFGIVIGMHLHF